MKREEVINKSEEGKSLLSDFQKKAIDEAFDDIVKGEVLTHDEVMDETKKRFPHFFKEI